MDRRWIAVSVPVVTAVVLDDQLTKSAAAHAGLVAHNPAYALGVVGGPARMLIVGTLLVMVAFIAFVARPAVAFGVSPIAPALIVGGMLGNAIDRVRLGAARDFVTTPWAIVNLADIAVATGIVAFVLAIGWRAYQMHMGESRVPALARYINR
jgi:lipoprotein signal peptidase